MRTGRITLKREILIEDQKWEQREVKEKEEQEQEKRLKDKKEEEEEKRRIFIDFMMWLV